MSIFLFIFALFHSCWSRRKYLGKLSLMSSKFYITIRNGTCDWDHPCLNICMSKTNYNNINYNIPRATFRSPATWCRWPNGARSQDKAWQQHSHDAQEADSPHLNPRQEKVIWIWERNKTTKQHGSVIQNVPHNRKMSLLWQTREMMLRAWTPEMSLLSYRIQRISRLGKIPIGTPDKISSCAGWNQSRPQLRPRRIHSTRLSFSRLLRFLSFLLFPSTRWGIKYCARIPPIS